MPELSSKEIKNGLFQIMDANLNRAREGLRVCEDIVRFVISDKTDARMLKYIRHRITDVIIGSKKQFLKKFISARDTEKDYLKFIDMPFQKQPADLKNLFMANMERAKESLRVLEECARLFDKGISNKYRKLRFALYNIEKRIAGHYVFAKKYDTD